MPDLELLYRAPFQLVNSDGVLSSYWKPIWFAKEAELVAVAYRAQNIPVVKVTRAKKREDMRTVLLLLLYSCYSQVQRKHGLLRNPGNDYYCCLDTSPGNLKLTGGWNSDVWALAKTTLEKSEALSVLKSPALLTRKESVVSDVSDQCAKEASEGTTNEWFTFRRNWREPDSYELSNAGS